MAKTKRTKPSKISAKNKSSKKPTTKGRDLPESAQWVLKFLNLRSIPGKQNLNKLPADVRKELRWLPQHPTKQISAKKKSEFERKEALEVKEAVEKLQDKTLSTHQQYEYTKKVETYVDDEGNVFSRKTKEFVGIEQCSPTLEDFKQFFLDEGIPPLKGTELLLENGKPLESLNTEVKYPETWYTPTHDDYSFELKLFIQISEWVWGELCRILGNMIHGTKTYDNEGSADESFNGFKKNILEKYNECLEDDEIPFKGGYSKNREADFRGIIDVVVDGVSGDSFPHYGMLPQAIYACILDFSYNHKGILSRLKQCPLCGKFRDKEERRGKYCSDECEDKYNSPSKEDNLKAQKKYREKLDKEERELAHNDIIKCLRELDCTLKDAKKIYEKTKHKNRKSLKEFKRTSDDYKQMVNISKYRSNSKG